MVVSEFSLFLMVGHPQADLSDLPRELGLTANRVWKAGERRTTPTGIPLPGSYGRSYCGLQVGQASLAALPQAIRGFLDHVRPRRAAIARLCESGGEFQLVVRWYSPGNTGESFQPDLLRDIAELGIALGLDIYGDKPFD
jgi:hypothetical protein